MRLYVPRAQGLCNNWMFGVTLAPSGTMVWQAGDDASTANTIVLCLQGYEEVHVPALKPKEFAAGEKLLAIADLPSWAQPAFKGMQSLNRVQSRVADMALYGVDNMLLCAPTGAGKTNVAMLAILHELGQHMNEDGTIKLNDFKVVYVAPMKVSHDTILHWAASVCV